MLTGPSVGPSTAGGPRHPHLNLEANGVLTVYFPEKGYGFLRPDDGGDDIFVHVTVAPDVALQVGGRYRVAYFDTPSGPRAKTVAAVSSNGNHG